VQRESPPTGLYPVNGYDFCWASSTQNRGAFLLHTLLFKSQFLIVEKVFFSPYGDMIINFTSGRELQFFPICSLNKSFWTLKYPEPWIKKLVLKMKNKKEKKIKKKISIKNLKGLFLLDGGRCLSLQMFRFGKLLPTKKNGKKIILSIHSEDYWRITDAKKVLAANRDLYFSSNLKNRHELGEWVYQAKNRRDVMVNKFFKKYNKIPLKVLDAHETTFGDLELESENNIYFQFFNFRSNSENKKNWLLI
jgi:hypothetical protein